MSSYVSDDWFRAVYRRISHRVALLDRPPTGSASDYRDLGPIFEEDDKQEYAHLLRSLLEAFKQQWQTPPSAISEQEIAPDQFTEEQTVLRSVWTLVNILDGLENEGISTKMVQPESEDIFLEGLRKLWMRDTGIYAKEKRDNLTPLWSFVAGRPFHEPPPKFKLFDAVPAADRKSRRETHITTRGKDSPERMILTSSRAALAMGLDTLIDDPFTSESGKTSPTEKVTNDTFERAFDPFHVESDNIPLIRNEAFVCVWDST